MDSNENSKFLNLFIYKMNRYDENILNKGIVTKTAESKAHLYKQILVSLRMNPMHKNIRIQIRNNLTSQLSYTKGLYKQSLKVLEKAKILARKHEEKNVVYDIVELEKIIESQYITRSLSNGQKHYSRIRGVRIQNNLLLSYQIFPSAL